MKRLCRSEADKIIGGVCGGLGSYLGIDPLILRILFVLLAMINGIGVTLYALLWIFVPRVHKEYAAGERVMRENLCEMRDRARQLGTEAKQAFGSTWGDPGQTNKRMMVGGAVLVGVGLLILLQNLGLLWSLTKLWPLVLVALGVIILLNELKGR